MPTIHLGRLLPTAPWIPTGRDCPACLGGFLCNNKFTGAEWCPECDYETKARQTGPGLDPASVHESPRDSMPPAHQLGVPDPSGSQSSGCALCEGMGYELIAYDGPTQGQPRRVGLMSDSRMAETIVRSLNLLRPLHHRFPIFSSRWIVT
jgi:hypothetical protein